jgi:predicted nucleic acid-binding protein
VAFFEATSEPLVVPQLVVGEAAYMVGTIGGIAAEARLLRELEASSPLFEPFQSEDLGRIAALIETYADLRLGTVDAAVVATAERLGAPMIATLDHRHFTVVRPKHVDAFELVP